MSVFKLIGQDIGVINISAPSTGCALSSASSVTIQIFNYGTSVNTSFNVSYRINAGVPVTETIVLGAPYPSGATYTYTFSTTANLSAFGNYIIEAYTTLTGDVNSANNTFVKSVNSDAFSIGGSISGPNIVCGGVNNGTLTLTGNTGNVLQWESSVNSGALWAVISNTTTSLNFNNLVTSTDYRVSVKNASCPSVYSAVFTVNVDPLTVGGIVASSDTVCFTGNSGTLTLSGHTGAVNRWESSVNSGSTWNNIVNNTASYPFANLTQTTIFRAQVQSGVCPLEYSSQATITVVPASVGGTLTGNSIVCSGTNNGTIELINYTGNVTHWESSVDFGTTWTTISNTTDTLNFANLNMETWYRASVLSCNPSEYSSVHVIEIDQPSVGGSISGSSIVCADNNSGTLTLSTNTGNVLKWEASINNGSTWGNILTTNTFFNYSNLVQTTLYRALVQNGVCPAVYSQTAEVTVDSVTVPGMVNTSTTACITGNTGSLELVNYTGSILKWQSSIDNGSIWSDITNTSSIQTYSNLATTTHFRAEVQSGVCAPGFSSPAIVTIVSASNAGNISGDNLVCYGNNGGIVEINGFTGTDIIWQYSEDEAVTWNNIQNLNAPSITYSNLTNKTLYRSFVNNGTCPSDTSAIVTVDIYERTVDAGNDITINRGESTSLTAAGGTTYLWLPDYNINSNSIYNPIVTPLITTTYILTSTDFNECVYSDTLTVTVNDGGDLKIATLITPNGDGFNDTWIIEPVILQSEVFVFNSSGREMFSSPSYDSTWNASYAGATLPDGTYYYVVKFEGKVYKGALTVLKGK